MVHGNASTQSRWVLRTLWIIAGLLVVAVLSVRSSSVLSQSQEMLERLQKGAALSFVVPTAARAPVVGFDDVTWPGHAAVHIHPGLVATVLPGTPLTIDGWAFDTEQNNVFVGIGAKIDANPAPIYAIVNLPRPDVATALRNTRARGSGFASVIETKGLSIGQHTITYRALAPDQKNSVALGSVTFAIGSPTLAAQRTDFIDAINGIIVDPAASSRTPVAVTRSIRKLTIDGWGFVTNGRRLASYTMILVDGVPVTPARYGLPRPDVARAFHDVRVARSGFEATLALDTVPNGVHEIRLRMGLSDGTSVDSATMLRVAIRNYL